MAGVSRRSVFKVTATGLAASLLPARVFAQEASRLTFLHTNDNYEITATRGWGGFAQLMTVLKEQRRASLNTTVTFGGDLLSPSIMSGLLKGAQMIDLMNAVGVDLAVPGNHEFDFGPDVLVERISESRFQWLASNVSRNGKLLDGTTSHVVRSLGGIKVGFFGIVTPDTAQESSAGPSVAFSGYQETASTTVRQLKEQGAEIIVALTHLTFSEDREIARTVPGISLILGGHDHDAATLLEGSTLIHKSGSDARYLGVIDLIVSRGAGGSSGSVPIMVTHSWRMLPVRGVVPDPEVAGIVKQYSVKLNAELSVEIGATVGALDSRRLVVREGEAAIGNLIADAIREAVGADVGLMNGGGIRGDRTYDPGSRLLRRDVLTELPFGNSTVLLELRGSDLLEALENGVSRVEDRQGRFPQISGMRFTYDPARPAMHRVVDASVGGIPLDLNRMYKVATIDFLVAGGDGYASLGRGRLLINASGGQLAAAHVMAYVTARRTVSASIEGRIQVRR